MLRIDTPSFFSFRAPKYRVDDGPWNPILRGMFAPTLNRAFTEIVGRYPESALAAARFNRNVQQMVVSMFISGISLAIAALAYLWVGRGGLALFGALTLLIAIALSYRAYLSFKSLVTIYYRSEADSDTPDRFEYFIITNDGAFER